MTDPVVRMVKAKILLDFTEYAFISHRRQKEVGQKHR